jgi:hypothetical protein
MSKHAVNTEALQAVIDYLQERPYKETAVLLSNLVKDSVEVTIVEPVKNPIEMVDVTPIIKELDNNES